MTKVSHDLSYILRARHFRVKRIRVRYWSFNLFPSVRIMQILFCFNIEQQAFW